MKIDYYLLDPTGNITILADTPVNSEEQPSVAARLMELEPDAEQVGFLTGTGTEDPALRMAGGEFCGNASMCAAVIQAERTGIREGTIELRVSGTAGPVKVSLTSDPDGTWRGTVDMPKPVEIRDHLLSGAGLCPVVHFDGISHVILERKMEQAEAERLAPLWCAALEAEALGIMFLDRIEKTLKPLVYVPAARTLCWENSCASGTAAAGAYLACREGRLMELALSEPGGILRIEAAPEGPLRLSGRVSIRKHASAEIQKEM